MFFFIFESIPIIYCIILNTQINLFVIFSFSIILYSQTLHILQSAYFVLASLIYHFGLTLLSHLLIIY